MFEASLPALNLLVVQQVLGIAIASASVIGILGGMIRWVVKHYLKDIKHELLPNSGKSMKDQITRLERRQNEERILLEKNTEIFTKKIDDNRISLESKIDHMNEENMKRFDNLYQIIITKL
jgi:hypothetical protein